MLTLSIALRVGLTGRGVTSVAVGVWLLVVDRDRALTVGLRTTDDNALASEGLRLLLRHDNCAPTASHTGSSAHHHPPLLLLSLHHAQHNEKDAANEKAETPPAESHPEVIAAVTCSVVVAVVASLMVGVVVVGVLTVSHLLI